MIQSIKQFYVSLCNVLVSWKTPEDFSFDYQINHVLLIRLDELGDFVLWLDSAKEYRKIYPDRRITLLVNEKWYDLAKSLDYWDEVIGINTTQFRFNPFYRIKWLMFIREQLFHTVICPRYTIQFLLEPAIVAISGAEHKIVFQGNYPLYKQNYWTRMIRSSAQEMHELKRNGEFLVGLGHYKFRSSVPKLPIEKMPTYNVIKNIVICPSSYRKEKIWPRDNFIKLMDRIRAKFDGQIIICNNKIMDFPEYEQTYNFTGSTDIMEFISIINGSSLVIANDSAPIHLASALDVPSICIGAGKWGRRFVPYDMDKTREGQVFPKVIYNQDVKSIKVEEVWFLVKGMI